MRAQKQAVIFFIWCHLKTIQKDYFTFIHYKITLYYAYFLKMYYSIYIYRLCSFTYFYASLSPPENISIFLLLKFFSCNRLQKVHFHVFCKSAFKCLSFPIALGFFLKLQDPVVMFQEVKLFINLFDLFNS